MRKENIEVLIKGLLDVLPVDSEIIVVDDDSPDGTWQTVQNMKQANVKCIRRQNTRGLAAAFNRGVIESRGDIVGWMDADNSMPPSVVPKMYQKIVTDGYDVVIGSRYASGGSDKRGPIRTISSRWINKLAGLVLGYGIKDYDSGFVLLKRDVFNSVTIMPHGFGEYFMEFIYHCCRKGFKVTEVGYEFKDRIHGESKSSQGFLKSVSTGMNYIKRILVARIRKVQ